MIADTRQLLLVKAEVSRLAEAPVAMVDLQGEDEVVEGERRGRPGPGPGRLLSTTTRMFPGNCLLMRGTFALAER